MIRRKRILFIASAGVLALGASFASGALLYSGGGTSSSKAGNEHAPEASSAGASTVTKKDGKIKYWVAPMDPTFISDKPGKSPMGMDLVPVYEDGGAPESSGTVTIDPVVVQNMGVRVANVERGPISRRVRTIGTLDVAENLESVVNLRYSGWVERIYVDETGVAVKRGQALFSIYSPELVSAQEEYLLALRAAGKDSPLARSARARLAFWDLSKGQVARIEPRGKALRTMTVVSPRSGFVLHKNVVQGARVEAGHDLYRIGNLDKIWVNADLYEFDAPWVNLGDAAEMELSFQQGKIYTGRVSFIHPTLNPKTRTLTVRLEFDNPGLSLKPGMFATVEIESQRKADVLLVATEAIIHSGTRQIVFVTPALGRYEMREIATGLVGDENLTEVVSGLEAGDQVVVSGQFLLDSESQLQEAIGKLLEARLQAKRKQTKGADAGGDEAERDSPSEISYWTCGMHPSVVQDGPGNCPICGMDLTEKKR
jgi:Cu(I)/Ag(I) efflux system membrane fusion protein/cobalt-zinc-cadmium efflux system membrane fusion protein